ncbi:MAG: HTH domain-containing protein [Candidatus Micrarchaeota archaeon]|nr:HTH domain-containing protein [Candidatus Micrarchaeota archaeon]
MGNVFWAITGGAKSSEQSSQLSKNSGSCKSSKVERTYVKVKKGNYLVAKTSSEESVVDRKRKELDPEKVGRPNCLDDVKLQEMLKLYYTHPYSYRQLADMFGVSRMTVWRAVQGIQFQL